MESGGGGGGLASLSFLLLLFLLPALTLLPQPGSCTSQPQPDFELYYDRDYYYDNEEEDMAPTFLARPQSFTVEVGQSVIIPCDAQDQGKHKLIIKKIRHRRMRVGGGVGHIAIGDGMWNGGGVAVGRGEDMAIDPAGREKILAAGSEKVTQDHRISLQGARLTISHARPRDAGTYKCLFELHPPVVLEHRLDVQFAPTIRALGAPEQHVKQGSTVTLECSAYGNPKPTIRWWRQEGPLPSGNTGQTGPVLELREVGRQGEGTYLCTAENGVGEAASAAMAITVEYPPEVTTHQSVVRTGEGDHVELVCVVRGRPAPEVVWTRDGHPLPDGLMDTHLHMPTNRVRGGEDTYTSDQPNSVHGQGLNSGQGSPQGSPQGHLIVAHLAHRHTLAIHNVSEKDFGAYVCIAENVHGDKNVVIQMTGLPEPPHITSSPQGGEGHSYTLTWTTNSYYPVTEFLIRHRRTHHGGWHQPNRTIVMTGTWERVSKAVMSEPEEEKEEEEEEEEEEEVGDGQRDEGGRRKRRTHHNLSYTLQGLEEATDYVAVVRVRNKYGWSSESDHFNFATKKAMSVLQSTSGANFRASASSVFHLLPLSLLLPFSFLLLILLSSPTRFLM